MQTADLSRTSSPAPADAVFEASRDVFRRQFDRDSFEFRHRLATHPLFELPRLLTLASQISRERPSDLYYDEGSVRVDQRWDESPKGEFPIEETIERIANNGAWIILRKADKDPEYGTLLNQCMNELRDLIGIDLNRVMRVQEIILFITSPKRVSTYHIDRECNFLLQIKGSKSLYVFHQKDRTVLPEEEIERFWTVDHNSAKYKPELQDRSTHYRLTPGAVVHIPVNAPHWVQNDDNISVSMSVNFQYKDSIKGNVYRANYALRRMGFHPTPPGESALRDSIKSYSMIPAVWAKRMVNRVRE